MDISGEPSVLPITERRQQIIEAINKNHVTIISATTGSGKTTQIPQYILEDAASKNKPCRILISQPRKIAASTIARHVAKMRGCEIGEEIGYQVGLDKQANRNDQMETKVLFCTTGVIVQKLITEKSMQKYSHVILDEVHERELDLDLLLIIVKEMLLQNSGETKLILMSATFSVKLFEEYFTFKTFGIEPAVIPLETNRNFKIDKFYLDDLPDFSRNRATVNYSRPGISEELYQLAEQIVLHQIAKSDQSILVFLPGIYEINTLYNLLSNSAELANKCLICVLHSSLSQKDQNYAFMPASKPKVILSTNIAESSVTINDVSCVIDFGLVKVIKRVGGSSLSSLVLEYAAKDSLDQRAGRTGRTCDGIVYRLIEKDFYNRNLPMHSTPEIMRCPLETTILRIKTFDIMTPMNLLSKALDPPDKAEIRKAINVLKQLGGLQRLNDNSKFDSLDGELTYAGRVMAALPMEPHIAKLIILGYLFSVLDEAIIIAAGLTTNSIFSSRISQSLNGYNQKLAWADGSGCDFNAILNAYMLWKYSVEQRKFSDRKSEEDWCRRLHLERKNLHEMRVLINEIKKRLNEVEMESLGGEFVVQWEENEKPLILKVCVAGAFYPNFFISGQSTEYFEEQMQKEVGNQNPCRTITFKGMDNQNYIGEIYEDQVKKQLVEAGVCRRASDIKVTFQKLSTKMYVEFPNEEIDKSRDKERFTTRFDDFNSTQIMGKVKTEVYRAVKLRQHGFRMKINVMTPAETKSYAEKHGIFERVPFENKKPIHTTKLPEFIVIPTIGTKSLEGVVTHIDHMGKFFIQPICEDNLEILFRMDAMLSEIASEAYSDVAELAIAQLVIVKHNNHFRRGKILNIRPSDQMTRCSLFDFGNVEICPIANVYKIRKEHDELFDIPERCFEASLCQIAPSFLKCPRGIWTADAIGEFSSLVLNREAVIEVYSVVDDITSVAIIIDGICVNDALVEAGYAQQCEEIFPKKLDNQKRIGTMFELSPKEEFQDRIHKIRVTPIPPPPMKYADQTLMLKGPASPMEAKIHYATLNPPSVEIMVDPQSVNAVVMYDDPCNIYGRMIVAANATKNLSGIILHETSIMPDIPSLPVLLGLLFAPDAVLHRNEKKTAYDALLLGLGGYETGKSYFPGNDCILPVNHEIDQQDLENINLIRFLMSYTLSTEQGAMFPSLSDEIKFKNLKNLKETIITVLSKNRWPVSFSNGEGSVDWAFKDLESIIGWQDTVRAAIYHHIDFPKLQAPSRKEVSSIIRKLANLDNEIVRGIKFSQLFECPLCNRSFEDTLCLQIHFNTKMHIHRLQLLKEWDAQQ